MQSWLFADQDDDYATRLTWCVCANQSNSGHGSIQGPLLGLLETYWADPVGVELLHINGFVGHLAIPRVSLSNSNHLAVLDQYGIGGIVGVANQGSIP